MSRPFQHYDDFTLSSTGENNDDYSDQHAIHQAQQPFPLKSTLPLQYRRSQQAQAPRPALPRGWSNPSEENDGPHVLQRDFARNSGGEDDVTLSTDAGTAADEYLGPSEERRRPTTVYEDDSYIPGVGRGHQRTGGGNGASSYSAHRDLLASSNLPVHPSPGTAARHDQLRRSTARGQHPSPLSSSTASDEEDSESGVESSSTSTTSFVMQPKGLMQSKAESTGNHYAYTSTQQRHSPVANRQDRPKLDARALDEMDRAVKKGRAAMRQEMPHSPSPEPSRRTMPRGSGVVRSRKEDWGSRSKQPDAGRHQSVQALDGAEGSNGSSGYGAGTDARKPSDGSSNGRKQAGTAGSTTGETLVEEGRREYFHPSALHPGERSPFIKLPSGQKVGRGVYPDSAVFLPDITGMTSALESPAKAIVGVEHRGIQPQALQASYLQTNEARMDEFNDLAYYVKNVEKNLDQTQKKVKAVEQTSLKCAKQVDELREEWSSWRGVKGKKATTTNADEESTEGEAADDYEGKVKAINEHIAQLTHDLHSYRNTMEQMRMEKLEREQAHQQRIKDKQLRLAERRRLTAVSHVAGAMSSSPIKSSRYDDEEEATHLEMIALRKQVNKVAREVERLRTIVDGGAVTFKAPITAKSARFAASVPAPVMRRDIGVGSQSPFLRRRTSVVQRSSLDKEYDHARHNSEFDDMHGRNSSPPPSVRGFNEVMHLDEGDVEGDETARPMEASPLHDPLQQDQRREEGEVEEEEEDVSMMAQTRAEKTFEVIQERGRGGHDERTCTVCLSKVQTDKKRQARRERVSRQVNGTYRDDEDEDERVLLSLLDTAGANPESVDMTSRSGIKHQAIVQRLLKEHLDEFYHHRMLYCELADELKQITPEMTRVKRKILAEHVMEAVEGLELRATRINLLQVLSSSRHPNEESRRSKDKKQRQRNVSPLVDDGDLYRRVVSA